jgi:hypothetical protein
MLRLMTVIQQEQIKSVWEERPLRQHDEDESKWEVNLDFSHSDNEDISKNGTLQEELNKAKHELHTLKEDIKKLEKDVEFMSNRKVTSDAFWQQASDDAIKDVAMSATAGCLSKSSEMEQYTRSYQSAVERAEKYKTRLSSKLEVLHKGGWPFDKEQGRTQEQ